MTSEGKKMSKIDKFAYQTISFYLYQPYNKTVSFSAFTTENKIHFTKVGSNKKKNISSHVQIVC